MSNQSETLISLYNHLTDVNFIQDDINFLESIKYKMDNGNKILEGLLSLKDMNIPFTIVKGFILNDERFSKFERCLLKIDGDINIESIRIPNVYLQKTTEVGIYEMYI